MSDNTQISDRELLELAAKALNDDGDALRLAVMRGMGVQVNGPNHWQSPNCTIVLFDGPVCGHRLTIQHDGDPYAATRRAIFRAAVENGLVDRKESK